MNNSETVKFYMPVEIPTGHPEYILKSAFIGRAIIEQESADEFTAYGVTATIQDLFFLQHTTRPTQTAVRVPLPDPKTGKGRMFRSLLETAALAAFNDQYSLNQDLFLPDELETVRL